MKFARIICIFFLVCLAWVFFRAPGIDAAFDILNSIFANFDPPSFNEDCSTVLDKFGGDPEASVELFILLGCIFLPVFLLVTEYLSFRAGCGDLAQYLGTFGRPVRWALYLAATLAIVFIFIFENGIYGQTGQFIYFQF